MKAVAGRQSQAERRAESRNALIQAAAQGFSEQGYAKLTLAQVASDAGYTRGAFYHQFSNKEELALAVIEWIGQQWRQSTRFETIVVGRGEPVAALLGLAGATTRFFRPGMARALLVLRMETSAGSEVAQAVEGLVRPIATKCAALIEEGRARGEIAGGPPAPVLALAMMFTVETLVISLSQFVPDDEVIVERVVRGILGLGADSEAVKP